MPSVDAEVSASWEYVEAELCRRSFAYFARRMLRLQTPPVEWEPAHQFIATRLEAFGLACERRASPRLALFMPPRHGKTTLCSVLFPLWMMGRNKGFEVIFGTHTSGFAMEVSTLAQTRIEEGHPGAVFPSLWKGKKWTEKWWRTPNGCAYRATGVGVGLFGKGGQLGILDDLYPTWAEAQSERYRFTVDQWFRSTFLSRISPGGGIIYVGHRLHHADIGSSLAKEGWEIVKLPAFAEAEDPLGRAPGEALMPRWMPPDHLAKIRAVSVGFNALYQQEPIPDEGNTWKGDWWKYFDADPMELGATMDEVVISCDLTFGSTSNTASYNVMQAWGRKGVNCYLLDQDRFRGPFTEQVPRLLALCRKWPMANAKLIEKKASGASVLDVLQTHVQGLIAVEPHGDKVARAQAVSALIQGGNAWLPEPTRAPFVRAFLEEATMFPGGAHDDQVDAASQALMRFVKPAPEFFVFLG